MRRQEKVIEFRTLMARVVGIHSGNAITILDADKRQQRVRLYGVCCPQRPQDFSKKARQFTARLLYNQKIRIEEIERRKDGSIEGLVYMNEVFANEEIVKSGLAWTHTL